MIQRMAVAATQSILAGLADLGAPAATSSSFHFLGSKPSTTFEPIDRLVGLPGSTSATLNDRPFLVKVSFAFSHSVKTVVAVGKMLCTPKRQPAGSTCKTSSFFA